MFIWITSYLKDKAHSRGPRTFTLFVEEACRAWYVVDQAAEETNFELGVDSKLVKLFIQAVRENKVNAVVAKVNGVFDNNILTENILVLWKNRLSTVLVQ